MNQLDQLGTRINLICNVFDKWIGQQDLNYNLFAVLYTLATEGSRTQKHIGEEWSLPKQTVSGICKTLAGQGLIEWQEGEQDRCERLLSLTEKGKAHAAPLTENAQEFSDKVFATFGDKRTTQLFADLDALAEVMEKTISENKNRKNKYVENVETHSQNPPQASARHVFSGRTGKHFDAGVSSVWRLGN